MSTTKLPLESAIGFNGSVPSGLISHPDGVHIVYPLGKTLVIKNLATKEQTFLAGHSGDITSVAISSDGSRLASGQVTHAGMKAEIILWDFAGKQVEKKLRPEHKVKVQALAFSCNDIYLASLGGMDDNFIVLWDMKRGRALQKVAANTERALAIKFYNNTDTMLVTAGNHNLRRWEIKEGNVLVPTDANLGTLRRIFKCITIASDDKTCFVGSTTGDLLSVALEPAIPALKNASCKCFGQGIRSVCWMLGSKGPVVVLGNGDGTVVQLNSKTLNLRETGSKINQTTGIRGSVTSVAPVRRSIHDVVSELHFGTNEANTYTCSLRGFDSPKLTASCHPHPINGVAFCKGFADVFVTCAYEDVRVWKTDTKQEVLRINVPNVECTCVCLPADGAVILSGWADGKIRAFQPQSGALKWVINDAHPRGVTALAVTNDCSRIISGGKQGQVRFWKMSTRHMQASLKEHKSQVRNVEVRSDDLECVTASDDGSCIVWNLKSNMRSKALFASTMFKNIKYHPEESQLLTCGSDRKVTYWDAYDGSAIRVIEGSTQEINALDIDVEGINYVSVGNNLKVKVTDYDTGTDIAVGEGHSGAINGVTFSPDQRRIVTVGAEGCIGVWDYSALSAGGGDEEKQGGVY